MAIFFRRALDDTEALEIANAMESAGAEVICISYRGSETYHETLAPTAQYVVWGRCNNEDAKKVMSEV